MQRLDLAGVPARTGKSSTRAAPAAWGSIQRRVASRVGARPQPAGEAAFGDSGDRL